MEKINSAVGGIIIAVIIGILGFMALGRADRYLRLKAIDDCGKVARFESQTAEGGRVSYPLGDLYQSCLRDKGYPLQ